MAHASVQFDRYSAMGGRRTDFEACYLFTENAAFPWGVHCHDFYEMYVHLRGGHFFSLDNHIYEMKPNQLYITPPFSMHGFVIRQNMVNLERAFLYISVETLRRAGCGIIDFDQHFQALAAGGHHQFSMTPEAAQKCRDMIIQLKENQHVQGTLARHRDYALLLPILNLMCETIERDHASQAVLPVKNILSDVWIYINEHYMEPVNVDELAKSFGISYSHLSHEFRKYTNRSIYDYILYRRIMLAKKLIPGSECMNDVAEKCGFESYSNFLRLFTREVGLSPSAYKKSLGSAKKD